VSYTQSGLPFQARSHSSYRGAEHASHRRGVKLMRLLRAYVAAGASGLTGHEAVEATGLPMQSLCSLRAALADAGEIRREGERLGRYGVVVDVHVVTEAGRLAVREAA
jgi:hypothetical protein